MSLVSLSSSPNAPETRDCQVLIEKKESKKNKKKKSSKYMWYFYAFGKYFEHSRLCFMPR